MANFTYEIPNEQTYLKTVLRMAEQETQYKGLYELIKGGYCIISPTNSYSRKRWDAIYTIINFYIPQSQFFEISSKLDFCRTSLEKICNLIMPAGAGYDVMEVNISPILDSKNDIIAEIEGSINYSGMDALSKDIIDKGKEMSEIYISLYCIENMLRDFIDKILTNEHGNDYWSKCIISNDVNKHITNRKNEETKNKWLPLRGNNNLYYLDFIELSNIITNNWDYFKPYFPAQSWIANKIDELYKIRCLIAHNSYLGDDEKDCVRLYFKQILKQIKK